MTLAWWFGGSSSDTPGDNHASTRRTTSSPRLHEAHTDAPLIARIQAGDITAFETLFRTEYPGLVRFATRWARSVDIAEDVVADVFSALWKHRTTWTPTRGVRAYLYGAVRNRLLNASRDARRRQELDTELSCADTIPALSSATEPADVAWERADPLRALDQVLAHLSERVRLVLTLRWQQQLDFDEIAAVLGTTRATALNLHARAMRALRRVFPQAYREYLG